MINYKVKIAFVNVIELVSNRGRYKTQPISQLIARLGEINSDYLVSRGSARKWQSIVLLFPLR